MKRRKEWTRHGHRNLKDFPFNPGPPTRKRGLGWPYPNPPKAGRLKRSKRHRAGTMRTKRNRMRNAMARESRRRNRR